MTGMKKKILGLVILFVKENLYVIERTELNKTSFDEDLWCVIRLSQAERLIVCLCYRSLNSTKENNEKMQMMLKQLRAVKARKIVEVCRSQPFWPERSWSR